MVVIDEQVLSFFISWFSIVLSYNVKYVSVNQKIFLLFSKIIYKRNDSYTSFGSLTLWTSRLDDAIYANGASLFLFCTRQITPRTYNLSDRIFLSAHMQHATSWNTPIFFILFSTHPGRIPPIMYKSSHRY